MPYILDPRWIDGHLAMMTERLEMNAGDSGALGYGVLASLA